MIGVHSQHPDSSTQCFLGFFTQRQQNLLRPLASTNGSVATVWNPGQKYQNDLAKSNSSRVLRHSAHLRGPQLQQQSPGLRLIVSSFLPQEASVGVKPRGRACAFGETCRSQKFPEPLARNLSRFLLICRPEQKGKKQNKTKCWVTEKNSNN